MKKRSENSTQGIQTPATTTVNMRSMNTLTHGEFVENEKKIKVRRTGTSVGQVLPWIVLAYLVGIACGIFMTQTVECEMKEGSKDSTNIKPDRAEGECNRLQAELNYLRTTISRQQELERQVRDSQIQQEQWERAAAEKEKQYQQQWMKSQQMWGAELQNRLEMMQREFNIQEANRVAEEEEHLAQNLEQQFTPTMVFPGYGAMPPPLPYQQQSSFGDFLNQDDSMSSPYVDGMIDNAIMNSDTQNGNEEDEILPTLEMSPSMMVDTPPTPSAATRTTSFRSSDPPAPDLKKKKSKKIRKKNSK